MSYPFDQRIKAIREKHKNDLLKPLDIFQMPSSNLETTRAKYADAINALMKKQSFLDQLNRISTALVGAVTAFFTSSAISTGKSIVSRLTNLFNPQNTITSVISLGMATTTFKLIYDMHGEEEGAAYLTQLENNLKNDQFKGQIKKTFNNIAIQIVRAYCLRQARIKAKENIETVNNDYLSELTGIINQAFVDIYDAHQQDIDADKAQPWLQTLFNQLLFKPDNKAKRTQDFQMGMLKFMARFHHELATEKSWAGKNAIKLTLFSFSTGTLAGAGIALLLLHLLLPSLTILWPVVLVSALGGGLLAGGIAYAYSKFAPLKRSKSERERNMYIKNILERQDKSITDRLLQTKDLTPKHAELLKKYQCDTNGYFSKPNVALGTAASWVRTFASHYAHSKLVENEFEQTCRTFAKRAEKQTIDLIDAIEKYHNEGNLSDFLKDYITATRTHLLSTENPVAKKFELIEKAKEQILDAVAQVGSNKTLPPNLYEFFKELGGNDDQINMAQQFCPASNDNDIYKPLGAKIKQLYNKINILSPTEPMFVGLSDDWTMLGNSTIDQPAITEANIATLLKNTQNVLKQLSPPAQPGVDAESFHTEAYYVYRTLLMRQFAHLLIKPTEQLSEEISKRIRAFIKETLHATPDDNSAISVDDALWDVFNHNEEKTTSDEEKDNLAFFAQAMRIDMAYHPIVSPAKRLEQAMQAFIDFKKTKPVLFGSSTLEVLDSKPNDIKETIKTLQENSIEFLKALQSSSTPSWDKSPVNLSDAYKYVLTQQSLFAIKTLLIKLMESTTDKKHQSDLKGALHSMLTFFFDPSHCYRLERGFPVYNELSSLLKDFFPKENITFPAKNYLEILYNLLGNNDEKLDECIRIHGLFFNLNDIYAGDFDIEAHHAGDDQALVQNIKLGQLRFIECANHWCSILWTPGSEYQLPDNQGESRVVTSGIFQKAVDFIQNLLTSHTTSTDLFQSFQEGVLNEDVLLSYLENNNDPAINQFIKNTKQFLYEIPTNNHHERDKLFADIKNFILNCIAKLPPGITIPSSLDAFYVNILRGNSIELAFAKKFYPHSAHNHYDPMQEKAGHVAWKIKRFREAPHRCFAGSRDLWEHIIPIDPETFAPQLNKIPEPIIGLQDIPKQLNDSKHLLRELIADPERIGFDDINYSEAYYVYRTLLLRQLEHLKTKGKLDPQSIQAIDEFITHTLEINRDLQSKTDATTLQTIAELIRFDISRTRSSTLPAMLDKCINEYVSSEEKSNHQHQQHQYIFGCSQAHVIALLNAETNALFSQDMDAFIHNTARFLEKLQAAPKPEDSWNFAPVDLTAFYKKELTIETLDIIIKTMKVMSSIDLKSDLEKFKTLRQSLAKMIGFYTQHCYAIRPGKIGNIQQHLEGMGEFLKDESLTNIKKKLKEERFLFLQEDQKIIHDQYRNCVFDPQKVNDNDFQHPEQEPLSQTDYYTTTNLTGETVTQIDMNDSTVQINTTQAKAAERKANDDQLRFSDWVVKHSSIFNQTSSRAPDPNVTQIQQPRC